MASWSQHSQYAHEQESYSQRPFTQDPCTQQQPYSSTSQQSYAQRPPSGGPYSQYPPPRQAPLAPAVEQPPVLPPRPRSSLQQGDYAAVTPPQPYGNASRPPSILGPPPAYDGSHSTTPRAVSPQPYYSNDTKQSHDAHSSFLPPQPMRPVSLPVRPHHTASQSSSSLTPTVSSDSSDLLDASDIKILEQGISAIPAPEHPPSYYPKLARPIAIPQLSVRSRLLHVMPFTRAHAPIATEQYGIPPADFVRMIDTINVCVAASPPFQAMHIAAAGVGVVPEPLFIGISLGLDALASAGTRTTKYFRLKSFLAKMNTQVWNPRGLEMRVIKDPDLVRDMLGLDESKLLAEMGQRSEDPYAAVNSELLSMKRYRLLGEKVQALEFDVPPPEKAGNIIDKISAKNQARKAERRRRKLLQRQIKHEDRNVARSEKSLAGSETGSMLSGSTLSPEMSNASGSGGRSRSRSRSNSAFDAERERVRSNAMEYDDSSTASSDSDDYDIDGAEPAYSISLRKATEKADAKAEKVNAKADEALAKSSSESKVAKIEAERNKELNKIEKEWSKVKEKSEVKNEKKQVKAEEKREKRYEKRVKDNTKRAEKAGKRMQRLEWIVITNLEEKPGPEADV